MDEGNKFRLRKRHVLEALADAREKGLVDQEMLPLIDMINSHPSYYTSSTCTGRTCIFHDPGFKPESSWLGKWHRKVEPGEVKDSLISLPKTGIVWFMHEPTIAHVIAKDMDSASRLVDLARNAGYKKVGMLSYKDERIIVEICGTERIDAPVAENGSMIVDLSYLDRLCGIANGRFARGMERLKRLERAVADL